jgi:Lar family restriction alleviation protein
MKRDELKPCPFCGGEAEVVDINDDSQQSGGSCVTCKQCLASSALEFEFRETFIERWNTRAQTAPYREALQWIPINSVEDLPKEDGEYLWQFREPHQGHKVQFYSGSPHWYVKEYEAYVLIPPYKALLGEGGECPECSGRGFKTETHRSFSTVSTCNHQQPHTEDKRSRSQEQEGGIG